MSNSQLPWGQVDFSSSTYHQKMNKINQFTLTRTVRGVRISSVIDATPQPEEEYILPKEAQIFLVPALPPLPVVIRPENRISIVTKTDLQIFLEVPLMVQIRYGSQKNNSLLWECRRETLLKTWFGTAEEGEMAYAIESPMYDNLGDLKLTKNFITCPIAISNHSSQILAFERMVLRVPYLTIYKGECRLYSGTTRITFTGPDQVSKITLPKAPPQVEERISIMTQAREQLGAHALRRSFSRIKTLYNG